MAIWSNLPIEIVEEILQDLDSADLMRNVFRVNRTLNFLAPIMCVRQCYDAESMCIVLGAGDSHLTLCALHRADWIKDVPILNVRLNLSQSIFREVHSLARFVNGLDSLGTLNLEITELEDGHNPSKLSTSDKEKEKSQYLWLKCIRTLQITAFLKGLKGLHTFETTPGLLQEYVYLGSLPRDSEGDLVLEHCKRKGREFLSSIWSMGGCSKKNPENPTTSPCICHICYCNAGARAHIEDIRISPMLLSHLFREKTMTLLNANASTIHTLNLNEANLYRRVFYDDSFGNLRYFRFPLLEQFIFARPATDSKFNIDTSSKFLDVLLLFLNNHPKVTHLELNNVPTHEKWALGFTQDAPSLPNLRTLIARNDFAAYILQRPGNCKHLELLHLWSLSPSYHPFISPGPGLALAAIASNVLHPIKVEIRLETEADCLRWLKGGIDPRCLVAPLNLRQVHDITIVLGSDIFRDKNLLFDVIPKWIGSFIALRRLQVEAHQFWYRADLVSAIRCHCPRLESLVMSGTVVRSRGS